MVYSSKEIADEVIKARLPLAPAAREMVTRWGCEAWAETLCTLEDDVDGKKVS